MKIVRPLFVIVALLYAALAGGTTFIPTTDRQLIERSDAVVVGTVRDVAGRETAEGTPLTDVTLAVEESLKGASLAGQTVTVTDFGGPSRGQFVFVAGGAVYKQGERVLLFLRHAPDGHWFTSGMSLGKFTFSRNTDGTAIVLRDTQGEVEGDAPRLAADFTRFIRDHARGLRGPDPVYLSPTPDAHLLVPETNSAASYALVAAPPSLPAHPVRLPSGSIIYSLTGTLSGINTNTFGTAAGSWTNDPNSFATISTAGTSPGT
ncbi:MAG: hypothetical protein JWN02_995, partial [Acidobacteria bacterium]|nr:hypothetical protein [Acidobacteriota bacterium]